MRVRPFDYLDQRVGDDMDCHHSRVNQDESKRDLYSMVRDLLLFEGHLRGNYRLFSSTFTHYD